MPLIYMWFFLLLTACVKPSATGEISAPPIKALAASEKDGAPSQPVTISFKEVIPQQEPLSRYGNPHSYKIGGQTYQVMQSANGYKTRGIASWYGTKFHKRRTSSGEHYDLYSLTAAHKTLPLPTYVKVKNLRNNREVIVKVNDRGPFRKRRIIDLSYAAASKLGFLTQGTAPVEVEALTHSHQAARYYLQAGAFNSVKLAKLLQTKLKDLTSSPVLIEKQKEQYIVKIGPFADVELTKAAKKKLETKGMGGVFSLLQ